DMAADDLVGLAGDGLVHCVSLIPTEEILVLEHDGNYRAATRCAPRRQIQLSLDFCSARKASKSCDFLCRREIGDLDLAPVDIGILLECCRRILPYGFVDEANRLAV